MATSVYDNGILLANLIEAPTKIISVQIPWPNLVQFIKYKVIKTNNSIGYPYQFWIGKPPCNYLFT